MTVLDAITDEKMKRKEYQERMDYIIDEIARKEGVEPLSPTIPMSSVAIHSPSGKNIVEAPGTPVVMSPPRMVLSPSKTLQNLTEKPV